MEKGAILHHIQHLSSYTVYDAISRLYALMDNNSGSKGSHKTVLFSNFACVVALCGVWLKKLCYMSVASSGDAFSDAITIDSVLINNQSLIFAYHL